MYQWMPYISKKPRKKRIRYNKFKYITEHNIYYKKNRDNRDNYLSEHPVCEICLLNDEYNMSEHIHHIKEISSGKDIEDKLYIATQLDSNLMALCKKHHMMIHNEPDKLTDAQREYLYNKQKYVESLYILHKYNKENIIEER